MLRRRTVKERDAHVDGCKAGLRYAERVLRAHGNDEGADLVAENGKRVVALVRATNQRLNDAPALVTLMGEAEADRMLRDAERKGKNGSL